MTERTELQKIKTLRDIRYEKARLKIQIMQTHQSIKENVDAMLRNNIVKDAAIGFSLFGQISKILILFKLIKKTSGWFSRFFHKKHTPQDQ